MEFLRLEQGEALAVGERISPIRLRDILPTGAKEADLEDLLVRYPGLMNWDEYNGEEPDLLVVSRQAKTFRNKRLDLLAVDTDGTLVVIEVKRDAADERVRTEAAEFQAIRYAANVCTLSAEEVVGLFAEHLAKSESGSLDDEAEAYAWRRKAERALAKHLGVKDPSDQEGLRAAIRPSEKQRICLVAADFDAEVTAACAWLLEHGVDIACFRLQPYRIDSVLCLNRERVVPPPDLGDFFGHMAAQHGVTGAGRHSDGPRRSADKPVFLSLGGSESSEYSSWTDVLKQVVKHVLSHGLPADHLPIPHSPVDDGERFWKAWQASDGLFIETHGSADQIAKWLGAILDALAKFKGTALPAGYLAVQTRSGRTLSFPA